MGFFRLFAANATDQVYVYQIFIHVRIRENNNMRVLCYIIGIAISLAVGIIPWFMAPIGVVTVLMSIAGAAMLILCIVGIAKGWDCVFGNA